MKSLLFRLGCCIAVFAFCLYSYLEAQNRLTQLKIRIPEVDREIRLIREENRRLSYEVDEFLSPAHLIELAHRPEFSHLKHPLLKDVLTVPEALAATPAP